MLTQDRNRRTPVTCCTRNSSTHRFGAIVRAVATGVVCLAIGACSSDAVKGTAPHTTIEKTLAQAPTREPVKEVDETDLLSSVTADATTPELALAKGDAAFSAGKRELAMAYYTRGAELDGRNLEALLKLAELYRVSEQEVLAAATYQRILAVEQGHAEANERLGMIATTNRQYAVAKTHLIRAIETDPGRWSAHNALGIIADVEGESATALQHYRQALKANPRSASVLNNLGYSYYLAGAEGNARVYLKRALNAVPGYERALHNLGFLDAKQGHYDTAIALLSKVMDKAAVYNNLGYICTMQGKYDEAERFFREALRLSPSFYPLASDNLEHLMSRRGGGLAQ